MVELFDIKPLSELSEDQGYQLIQSDFEIDSILESSGYNGADRYGFLIVKMADNGAEYSEIWAGDSPNLDANYELISHLKEGDQ